MRLDDLGMACERRGDGEPLVLVHGSVNDLRYWAPQMATLSAAFETIALSLRHYWPNPWDGAAPFSIERQIADVVTVLERIGRGPVRLLGHSRGGYIAFRVAERRPDLVERLALAEPAGVLDESLAPAGGAPSDYSALIADAVACVRRGDIETGLDRFFDYAIGAGGWAALPEARKQICRDNALTLIGQIDEGRRPYSRASAQAIARPTLILDGAKTQPIFSSIATTLAGAVPAARRVQIPCATHLLNWDNSAAFDAAVLDFMAAG